MKTLVALKMRSNIVCTHIKPNNIFIYSNNNEYEVCITDTIYIAPNNLIRCYSFKKIPFHI